MPRKHTQKHPIRDLRDIIRVSQRGFAEAIGISPAALRDIENNVRRLSRTTARLISIEAGIDHNQLLKGKLRKAGGGEFTLKSYVDWKESLTKHDEGSAREFAKRIACWIDVLFHAAAAKKPKLEGRTWRSQLWQVRESLALALDDLREDFNLGGRIENVLEKYKVRDRNSGEWVTDAWYPQGGGSPKKLYEELYGAATMPKKIRKQ